MDRPHYEEMVGNLNRLLENDGPDIEVIGQIKFRQGHFPSENLGVSLIQGITVEEGTDMYQFIDRLHTLYGLLQDERSKDIFQARFAIDMEWSIPNYQRLVSLGNFKDPIFMRLLQPLEDVLKKLNREHKKIILYGTANTGKFFAERLQLEHIDFYGFCGQDSGSFPDGLLGKPVISPNELIAHKDEYYVVRTVTMPAAYRDFRLSSGTQLSGGSYS